jgi:DNA replication protein DnaC
MVQTETGWSCNKCGNPVPPMPAAYLPKTAAGRAVAKLMGGQSYTCDVCMAAYEAREKEMRVHQNIVQLRRLGLLPIGIEMYDWSRSSPSIEKFNDAQWNWAKEWVPPGALGKNRGNVFVTGPPGVGKTYLCRTILSRFLWEEMSCASLTGQRFQDFMLDRKLAKEAFDYMGQCRILHVEDLDKAKWSERGFTAFREVLQARAENGGALLICANMAAEPMARTWAQIEGVSKATVQSTWERMKPLTTLQLLGPSHRQR